MRLYGALPCTRGNVIDRCEQYVYEYVWLYIVYAALKKRLFFYCQIAFSVKTKEKYETTIASISGDLNILPFVIISSVYGHTFTRMRMLRRANRFAGEEWRK